MVFADREINCSGQEIAEAPASRRLFQARPLHVRCGSE